LTVPATSISKDTASLDSSPYTSWGNQRVATESLAYLRSVSRVATESLALTRVRREKREKMMLEWLSAPQFHLIYKKLKERRQVQYSTLKMSTPINILYKLIPILAFVTSYVTCQVGYFLLEYLELEQRNKTHFVARNPSFLIAKWEYLL